MLSRRCLLESVDDEKPLESTSRHLDTKLQKSYFCFFFKKFVLDHKGNHFWNWTQSQKLKIQLYFIILIDCFHELLSESFSKYSGMVTGLIARRDKLCC